MSAEEHIYYTYGGVNSDDFSDYQDVSGDCTIEAPCTNKRTTLTERVEKEFTASILRGYKPKSKYKSEDVITSSLIHRKVVEVRFDSNGTLSEKSYAYFTDIEDLSPSDYVIVVVGDTPKIAMVSRVRGISKDSHAKACKWIASRVDLTDYYIKVKQDELIQQIESELDAEMNRINRIEVLKACAKNSKVMQSLLSKLEELNPNIKLLEEESK